MEKYTVVIEGTFNDNKMQSEEFAQYSKRSNANGEAHGGIVKNKFMIEENLTQSNTPHFVILIEFPSKDAAKKAFTSEEYLSIIYLRDIIFKDVKILLPQ